MIAIIILLRLVEYENESLFVVFISRPQHPFIKANEKLTNGVDLATRKLLFQGINSNISENALRAYFMKFGQVVHIFTKPPVGHVIFDSTIAAEKVMAKSNHALCGARLHFNWTDNTVQLSPILLSSSIAFFNFAHFHQFKTPKTLLLRQRY